MEGLEKVEKNFNRNDSMLNVILSISNLHFKLIKTVCISRYSSDWVSSISFKGNGVLQGHTRKGRIKPL